MASILALYLVQIFVLSNGFSQIVEEEGEIAQPAYRHLNSSFLKIYQNGIFSLPKGKKHLNRGEREKHFTILETYLSKIQEIQKLGK